jgi:phenylalanyl-tRNA synthetase beta chain
MLWNINRKTKDLRLFELGRVYTKSPSGELSERHELSIGITGQSFTSWAGGNRQARFYELKGIVECLMAELSIKDISFRYAGNGTFSSAECAEIVASGTVIGILGEVSAKILEGFDIKEKIYICLIDTDTAVKHAKMTKAFEALPKYPSIYRDISVLADSATHNDDIVGAIRQAGGSILKDARLVDRYTGKQIPADKVSLTYRLEYQDPSRTLEEKDVVKVHDEVLKTLDRKFGAKLRL